MRKWNFGHWNLKIICLNSYLAEERFLLRLAGDVAAAPAAAAVAMAREFIEGWDLLQILGEGTFGEVKLLVNRATGEACAMKEIDLAQAHTAATGDPAATRDAVLKEICVHKLLRQVHLLTFISFISSSVIN